MVDSGTTLAASERALLRRKRERGSHERRAVEAILDEGLVCHVGFAQETSTFVVPTAYARVGSTIYLHGATANRMLRALASGVEACLTVTLLDGLVLSRSAFRHSMNYRSVMLFGTASVVEDPDEKRAAVLAIVDHMVPGRSRDARPPTSRELRATAVVRFPIEEGSAKIRIGGPVEEPEDLALPIWAGQVPFELVAGAPVADGGGLRGVEVPGYITPYPRRRRGGECPPTSRTGSATRPLPRG